MGRIHGLSGHALYRKRRRMLNRCYNKNVPRYKNYGGRGIVVCDEWKNSVVSFYNWAMLNGYQEGLSIERIDVNGNYEPSNCIFIPMAKQACNKLTTIIVDINGIKHTLKEWASISGVNVGTLQSRRRRGVQGEDFIKPPTRGYIARLSRETGIPVGRLQNRICRGYSGEMLTRKEYLHSHIIEINGETKSCTEWAREHGLNVSTILWRLKTGKSGEELICAPKNGSR